MFMAGPADRDQDVGHPDAHLAVEHPRRQVGLDRPPPSEDAPSRLRAVSRHHERDHGQDERAEWVDVGPPD